MRVETLADYIRCLKWALEEAQTHLADKDYDYIESSIKDAEDLLAEMKAKFVKETA